MSPSFKHLFVYDESVSDKCADASISTELGRGRVQVADVDTVVYNTSVICALVLSIPLTIIGELSGNDENWTSMMQSLPDLSNGDQFCKPSPDSSNLYSNVCLTTFSYYYRRLFFSTIACFYTACASLFMAVFYYMCRPSESSNCFSMIQLIEAYKIEVRDNIRRQRQMQQRDVHSKLESETDVEVSELLRRFEDSEVFFYAKFLAENKMQELMNHEFYMWYRSEEQRIVAVLLDIFFVQQFVVVLCPISRISVLKHSAF